MAEDDLLITRRGPIATATFNRPHARNALTFAMYDGLAKLCGDLADDDGIRVLVIAGSGTHAFAAGTDIAQFASFENDADALAYEARIERVLTALERCRVPTIAALAGACTGGGAAIAACCDLRIAATNLRFGFPIARTLGNCLSAQNLARLVGLLGEARVKDLIFTARLYGAEEAAAAGLVSAIVAPEDLEERAEDLAREVATKAPLTLRSTKEGLARLRHAACPADDLVLMCYHSRDFREGVAAFAAKRTADWEGC